MKPERAKELYSDYAEGALSPALRQALEQHFENDPEARADYQEFAAVFQLLDAQTYEEVDVPVGFRAKILERVSRETSAREAAAAGSSRFTLFHWFQSSGRRRATGGIAAALGVCALFGIIFSAHPTGNTNSASLGFQFPFSSAISTTLAGVSVTQGASGAHYNFEIHLPPNVHSAVVNAYILSDNAQITDPQLLSQATPALTPPQLLTNNESMTIPVTVLAATAPGTTLGMLVQWTPTGSQATDSQVIFTPTQPGVPVTSPKPLPANANFYDALQTIAADDGVTVIADSGTVPTQTISASVGDSSAQALTNLQSVAEQINGTVQQLPGGAYLVSPSQS
jgi:hypothetical protein